MGKDLGGGRNTRVVDGELRWDRALGLEVELDGIIGRCLVCLLTAIATPAQRRPSATPRPLCTLKPFLLHRGTRISASIIYYSHYFFGHILLERFSLHGRSKARRRASISVDRSHIEAIRISHLRGRVRCACVICVSIIK